MSVACLLTGQAGRSPFIRFNSLVRACLMLNFIMGYILFPHGGPREAVKI
ncbi:spermidine/putrescine transport system ATP-binding protein (plasmid) [Salipiger abyssi]|uniref:Spermidine/putrescine transport system ATP-binding protein n=1 Tax=Salipiger abyssi TaxID=1250539 RepID=A0A1P8ULZ7_9RHOB|nr:spermidine/putrescine transport system ATP-binding protein [Salipiger abyssi]